MTVGLHAVPLSASKAGLCSMELCVSQSLQNISWGFRNKRENQSLQKAGNWEITKYFNTHYMATCMTGANTTTKPLNDYNRFHNRNSKKIPSRLKVMLLHFLSKMLWRKILAFLVNINIHVITNRLLMFSLRTYCFWSIILPFSPRVFYHRLSLQKTELTNNSLHGVESFLRT
jgi:hypothetical protein